MKKLIPALAASSAVALALTACSDPQTASAEAAASVGDATFDVATVQTVPDIAALVPTAIKDKGTLTNGVSADFAPAEFMADDGQTPIGYEIDIVNAVAAVLGLKATSEHNDFATILPQLGSKFDVAASSFTVTPERLEQVNMISYINVGSSYAVAKGNPTGFNPEDPCGSTIGVLNGSYQQEFVASVSDECVKNNKPEIKVMPHDAQTEIAPKVIGGQYDATLSDSPVISYTIKQAGGQLEQAGDVIEAEAQGIAVAKDNTELAEAVHKALQHLIDEGILAKILDQYGAGDSALPAAELNPGK